MSLALFNETKDDTPDKTGAEGFAGCDALTDPTRLGPETIRAGENIWFDADLLAQTRPGLRFNTALTRTAVGAEAVKVRGLGYYDIPAKEAVLVSGDGKLYEITGAGNAATSNVLTPTPSATATAHFAQLVDRMFYSEGTLRWSLWSGVAWSHGSVTAFSNAAAMPAWGVICAHGLRLLAYDPATDKIHASAVGQASAAGDWVQTENIRVGTGEGDPVLALISGQNGFLVVIKERSAWYVDTSDASVGNWSSRRITNLAGAVAGRTAVQVGQDVLFLSSFGVVALGALATTDSISPAANLSRPLQPFIDRINPAALGTAWATLWRDHYLLAVPLDAATQPSHLLPFNTTTRRWGAPWACTMPAHSVGAGVAFTGWSGAVVANFGAVQETLLADNTGRVFRLDRTYEKDESAPNVTQDIVSWLTIRACDHGLAENWKQPLLAIVEWFNSTGADVQINLVRDGRRSYPDLALNACEVIAANLATNALMTFPIKFPWQFQPNAGYTRQFPLRGRGRYKHASLQIVSRKNRLKLRAARLASFVDAPDLM
jgi:hypothetical protein